MYKNDMYIINFKRVYCVDGIRKMIDLVDLCQRSGNQFR